MSRRIRDLEPHVQGVAGDWLRLCGAKGVPVLVYCTKRTLSEQLALWKKGRELKPGEDPAKASSWVRTPGCRIVTKARPGSSFHNYGLALDAAPYEFLVERDLTIAKKLDWTPFASKADETAFRDTGGLGYLDKRWRVMVEAADEVGLEWAGRWPRFIEYVHFQLTAGVTLAELRSNA